MPCETSLTAGLEYVRTSSKACRVLLHSGQHVQLPEAELSFGNVPSAQSFAQVIGRTKYWAAPIDLVLLPDPVFVTKSSLIITRDLRLYDELTYDIYSQRLWEELNVIDDRLRLSDWYSDRIQALQPIPGLSIIIHPRWHKVYTHWFSEALTALYDPASRVELFSNICIPHGPKFQTDSLVIETGMKSRIRVLDAPLYRFEVAAIPTHLLARTWTHPAVMTGLTDFASRTKVAVGPSFSETELIYLSREDAPARKMINEPELAENLTLLGFKKIIATEFDYFGQVKIFSAAKVLISPHGSGLTNMIFMDRGTSVLELRPMYAGNRGRLYDRSYHVLAGLMGRRYSISVTENDPEIEQWNCDIPTAVKAAKAVLDASVMS